MTNINFTVENLESILMIFTRVTALIFSAPFFSTSNVPRRFKISLGLFVSLLIYNVFPYQQLEYAGVIGYAILILKETAVGLLIGLSANVCTMIVLFSGQMIDMEIGFSMVSMFDPMTKTQTTITSNFYLYMVTIMLIVMDMHHFVLKALINTFELIPLGGIIIRPSLYTVMVKFLSNYIIIGFRIILPVFAAILVVNVILGILAKVAPQMSLFVIGMQIKVFVGLFVLLAITILMPGVANFISNEMKNMMTSVIEGMSR